MEGAKRVERTLPMNPMVFLLFDLDGFEVFEDMVDAFHFVQVHVLADAVLQAEGVPQKFAEFFGDIGDGFVVDGFHVSLTSFA
jgi:hypothetical protein